MHRNIYFKHFLLFILLIGFKSTIAQNIIINGPAGSGSFGQLYILANGNYVVSDNEYDEGLLTNIGAVYLYDGTTNTVISTIKGSNNNDRVGNHINLLENGNFVITSIYWNNGRGAATWASSVTGVSGIVSSSNSLVGGSTFDGVGYPIIPLPNGNYIVQSSYWRDAQGTRAGAITFGNGNTGISGVISSTNSLMSPYPGDGGFGAVTILTNSNYVISHSWENDRGSVIWCSGITGRTGLVSSTNSLIGQYAGNNIGSGGVYALSNGNYVVCSPRWENSTAAYDRGAVTWCDGTTGRTGFVTTSNSITGNVAQDSIGFNGIIALSNGNYIIKSPKWDNGSILDVGAATWCMGTGITTGSVNVSNSIIGNSTGDMIGDGYYNSVALENGNYVLVSPKWDNGAIQDAGAVTWVNGNAPSSGRVTALNSLIGTTADDISYDSRISVLTNGNYVVRSFTWDNGSVIDAGAATWCNGVSGLTGVISSSNSLVGANSGDSVGYLLTSLTNGNYVVGSPFWDNSAAVDAGAATWGNGTIGITGNINVGNSYIGNSAGDSVGSYNGTVALTNGNYVVPSPVYDNGTVVDAGAVTWGNGVSGSSGIISPTNSLVGSATDDRVGLGGIIRIPNGHYIAVSHLWDNGIITNGGAATLLSGNTGTGGVITSLTSVLGNVSGQVGSFIRSEYNSVTGLWMTSIRQENKIVIRIPGVLRIANTLDSISYNISGTNPALAIAINESGLIATVTPNGSNPVSGTVNAKVWIEPSVFVHLGNPIVARHTQITPVNNASNATGKVTLYFTQQEFTDFNAHSSSTFDLPVNSGDLNGISNLRIFKYQGISSDGTGLPDTYSGTSEIIDPADTDIIWNSDKNWWEVSFDVTGFSGFFVQSKLTALPLKLLEFTARAVENDALLHWKTTAEINTSSFEIQRSIDGRIYTTVGTAVALNQPGINTYSYTDLNVLNLAPYIYYRLKQLDLDGSFTYSNIEVVDCKKKSAVSIYPNPVIGQANIFVIVSKSQDVKMEVFDKIGKLVKQFQLNLVPGENKFIMDMSNFPKGAYLISISGETFAENKQFLLQ